MAPLNWVAIYIHYTTEDLHKAPSMGIYSWLPDTKTTIICVTSTMTDYVAFTIRTKLCTGRSKYLTVPIRFPFLFI